MVIESTIARTSPTQRSMNLEREAKEDGFCYARGQVLQTDGKRRGFVGQSPSILSLALPPNMHCEPSPLPNSHGDAQVEARVAVSSL